MKKTILITGAGSGLGKEAAINLSRRGHKVIATVFYKSQISILNEIAANENLDLTIFKLDVRNKNDRELLLKYHFDILISDAAIGDSGSVADIYVDRVRDVFETNVFSNLEIIQIALSKMIPRNHGRVIILSSIAGRIPFAFLSPYCASKYALECFGICLNKELKKLPNNQIKISLIEPGAYATGFNKENNEKKYAWMFKNSYFKNIANKIQKKEESKWNFIEQKSFSSIIQKYIHAVEDKRPKFRYYAPWWQAISIQLLRIFGK